MSDLARGLVMVKAPDWERGLETALDSVPPDLASDSQRELKPAWLLDLFRT